LQIDNVTVYYLYNIITYRKSKGSIIHFYSHKNKCRINLSEHPVVHHAQAGKEAPVSHVTICFLLTLSGREVRQVQQLFRNIYHSKHYYYVHIDGVSRNMIKVKYDLLKKIKILHQDAMFQ
jgi:hypothetical protein